MPTARHAPFTRYKLIPSRVAGSFAPFVRNSHLVAVAMDATVAICRRTLGKLCMTIA
jgi:hypothetical protein